MVRPEDAPPGEHAANIALDTLHLIPIPTPWPVGDINTYLAEGDPLTLIDSGPKTDEARATLLAGLDELGHQMADIKRIIITHAHTDHYGLAGEVVAASGAELWTHPYNERRLSNPAEDRRRMRDFFAELWSEAGVPDEMQREIEAMGRASDSYADRVSVSHHIDEGDRLRFARLEWKVLHTPGHAGGLVCFYNREQRLLQSNDHLLATVSSNPLSEPSADPGGKRPRRLVEYMAQLKRVAELDVDMAFPGHGPLISDHRTLIEERLVFHEKRAAKLRRYLSEEGEKNLYEITQHRFPELRGLQMFLALSEMLGHIDVLEVRGQVKRVARGGVTYWQAV